MNKKIKVYVQTVYGDEIIFDIHRNGDVVNTYNGFYLCNLATEDSTSCILPHYLKMFESAYASLWRPAMNNYIDEINSFIKESEKYGFKIEEIDGQYISTSRCQHCGKLFKSPVELVFCDDRDDGGAINGQFHVQVRGLKEHCGNCESEFAGRE